MNIDSITTGMTISCTIYGNIGGRNQYSGKVASIISGEFVPQTSNADVNHANIYPTLPTERKERFTNNYATYKYVQLALDDGSMAYLGLPWIIDTTITEVGESRLDLQIGNFNEADFDRILLWIEKGGWTVTSRAIVKV